MTLSSVDIPQANDPERVVRLARHLARQPGAPLPADFAHPRDRHFYTGALRALGVLDAEDRPTDRLAALADAEDPRRAFGRALAASPVGAAWLVWARAGELDRLDPGTAVAFLTACSTLSPTTVQRRASTLRRWLEWCHGSTRTPEPERPPPAVIEPPAAPERRAAETPRPPADPHRLLAGIARARAQLRLDTTDLCFLAALYLKSDRGALVSYDDDALVSVYETVAEDFEPGADLVRKRATHTIQRLRDDRLLQRVDGAGLVRAGEYTLTSLGAGIVEFYVRDEALTKESLVLLTRMLHSNLAEVRKRARRARGDEWQSEVIGPLSITVRDLVDGIRRRQRGLDAQQEDLQEEIGSLLHEKWLEAIEACQRLLDATSTTLRELNEVLLRDTHQLVTALQEIQELATDAEVPEAAEAAQRVIEQVDVITAWGSARQRAWSEYYQYVHRFLQDVVRLDPDRALSQRLRELITGFPERPFGHVHARAPSIRLLRPVEARVPRSPVVGDADAAERPLELVAAEDTRSWLEERVLAAIASGADTLAEVTRRVLLHVGESERFAAAGRVAAIVAELAAVSTELERPWVLAGGRLEIGDWVIDGLREEA